MREDFFFCFIREGLHHGTAHFFDYFSELQYDGMLEVATKFLVYAEELLQRLKEKND